MRKLKEIETRIVAMFVPIALLVLFIHGIVVYGWLGGGGIGTTEPSDLPLQIGCGLVVLFLSMYLIMRYAGEEDISHRYFIFLN